MKHAALFGLSGFAFATTLVATFAAIPTSSPLPPVPAALPFAASSPDPAASPNGINLGGFVPFCTGKEVTDLARFLRPWKPIGNSPVSSTSSAGSLANSSAVALTLTSSGYPLSDATTSTVAAGYPLGVYRLRYRGTATITMSGWGATVGPVTRGPDGISRADVTLAGSAGTLTVNATGLNPADPLADLRLIRPGYDPENPPTFSEDFLRRLRPFPVIRAMCWCAVNTTTAREWSDRVEPGDFLQCGPNGVAYETIIELANTLHRDIWINVPDQASDDYVWQMAGLFRDRLSADLIVYLEYTNEPWNTMFPAFGRILATAKTDPTITASDDLGKVAQWTARRTVQVERIWKAAWGTQAGRIRATLGGQNNNAYFARKGLAFLNSSASGLGVNVKAELFGLNIAPYVNLPASLDIDGLTVDGLFDGLSANLSSVVVTGIQAHAALSQQYGLTLLAYEAGQSVSDVRSGHVVNHAVKLAAQTDPRMGDLHRSLAATWRAAGGGLLCWFGPPASIEDQNGYWSLLPGGSADAPGGVKWDAVLGMVLPPGDVTLDGRVDFGDYLIIRSNLNAPAGLGPFWREQGDLTGDGIVDGSDVTAWLAVAEITDPQRAMVGMEK